MTKSLRFGREALLWTGGVLGALCVLMLAAGWLFNVTPLVFSSGSMSPAYEAGALGISREVPATDLEVGDVVSVVNSQGDRVTHRVVSVTGVGDGAVLTLKGDTNNVPDAEAYNVTSVDRVSFGIPLAGYVLNAAASPFGLLVAAMLVGSSLWLGFGRRDVDSEPATPGRRSVLVPMGITGVVLAGTALGVSGQAPWAFTSAYWTDSSTVTAAASTPAVVVDVIAPTVTMTYPNGVDPINNGHWTNNACTLVAKPAGVCGTATDNVGGSGVALGNAGYELRRTSVAPNTCWNGSAFLAAACGSYQVAGGTQASWSIGIAFSSVPNGTYQVRIKVSDVAGNTNRSGAVPAGTPDITFTR